MIRFASFAFKLVHNCVYIVHDTLCMCVFVSFVVVNMHIFAIKTLANFASMFCHFTF